MCDPYLPSDKFLLWRCWEVRWNAQQTPPHHPLSTWQSSPWRPNVLHATGHRWGLNLESGVGGFDGTKMSSKNTRGIGFYLKIRNTSCEEQNDQWVKRFSWKINQVKFSNNYCKTFIYALSLVEFIIKKSRGFKCDWVMGEYCWLSRV